MLLLGVLFSKSSTDVVSSTIRFRSRLLVLLGTTWLESAEREGVVAIAVT